MRARARAETAENEEEEQWRIATCTCVCVCVCVCTWTRRRDAPRLRATRIDEQDETSSNNLIYEYFAATRMLRTSFEYFGAALTNLAKLRKYPRAPTRDNARRLLLLVAAFLLFYRVAKTVASQPRYARVRRMETHSPTNVRASGRRANFWLKNTARRADSCEHLQK